MQGFKRIFYTPDEVAQIIAHCEEHLIKAKIITSPFSATEIQGGILKEHLTDEDYLAPQKVNFHVVIIPKYVSHGWNHINQNYLLDIISFYIFCEKND